VCLVDATDILIAAIIFYSTLLSDVSFFNWKGNTNNHINTSLLRCIISFSWLNRLVIKVVPGALPRHGEPAEAKLVRKSKAFGSSGINTVWICTHGYYIQSCNEQRDEQLCVRRLSPCSCILCHGPFGMVF